MSSSTDKERARRLAIESERVQPDPSEPRHATRPDERPKFGGVVLKAILALPGAPFEVEEWSATVYDLPTWRTVTPGDVHLSFVADPLTVYHLGALRELAPGRLSAVEVMYLDGKPTRSRFGVGKPDGRGLWHTRPITSLAKAIREHREA